MKKVNIGKDYAPRATMKDLLDDDIPHRGQVMLANEIFLGNHNDNSSLANSEIEKKIRGYKNQDSKKGIHDASTLITLEECLEKMVAAKLLCSYCSTPMKIIYKMARDPTQWTLDRVDNDLGHTNKNTVVACLGCNLQRRRTDSEKFSFTKKLVIKKT